MRTGSHVTASTKFTTTRVASKRPKDCTAGTGEKMLAANANADVVDLHAYVCGSRRGHGCTLPGSSRFWPLSAHIHVVTT